MIISQMYFHTSILISQETNTGCVFLPSGSNSPSNSSIIRMLSPKKKKLFSKIDQKSSWFFGENSRGYAPQLCITGLRLAHPTQLVLNVWPQWFWPTLALQQALSWKLYLLESLYIWDLGVLFLVWGVCVSMLGLCLWQRLLLHLPTRSLCLVLAITPVR